MEEKVTFLIFKELKQLALKIEEIEDSDFIVALKREIKAIKRENEELRNELQRTKV